MRSLWTAILTWSHVRRKVRELERWAIRCKSLVQPYFDYRSPLWDKCRKLLKDKIHRFQSRAPRVNTSASYDIRSADLIEALSWDTLDKRRLRAKSVLMYKILNDDPATNLRNSFVRRNTNQTNYHLRNSVTDLTLTKPKSEFLKKVLHTVVLWFGTNL